MLKLVLFGQTHGLEETGLGKMLAMFTFSVSAYCELDKKCDVCDERDPPREGNRLLVTICLNHVYSCLFATGSDISIQCQSESVKLFGGPLSCPGNCPGPLISLIHHVLF